MPKPKVGFSAARKMLIDALRSGCFEFEIGEVRSGKNLLQTGEISCEFLIELLGRCRGDQHSATPHHTDSEVLCHIFKPEAKRVRWYIKCYFLAADTVLISVHIAEH